MIKAEIIADSKNEYRDTHPSETTLDNYKGFKYLIKNNGTIEDLVKTVRQILLSEEII